MLRWATRRAPTTQKYLSRNRAIVGPDGRIGVYRKVHLWGAENLFFEPGDLGIGVWKTMFGRMSVAICYDGWSCAAQCRRGTFLADQVRRIDRSRKFVRRNPVWRSRAARLQQSLTICRSDPGRREAVRNKSIGRRNSWRGFAPARHGVFVVAPIARVPAFDASLGTRFTEEEGHGPKLRTYREQNQELKERLVSRAARYTGSYPIPAYGKHLSNQCRGDREEASLLIRAARSAFYPRRRRAGTGLERRPASTSSVRRGLGPRPWCDDNHGFADRSAPTELFDQAASRTHGMMQQSHLASRPFDPVSVPSSRTRRSHHDEVHCDRLHRQRRLSPHIVRTGNADCST